MVKSITRSLKILESLQTRGGATVSELTEELEIPQSTIYNHLRTLEDQGYLVKNNSSYSLGLRFLELGEFSRNQYKLYRVGKDEIAKLGQKTGELVNMTVEENGEAVCLSSEQGERAANLETPSGRRDKMHCSARGKAILAYLPEERRDEIIATHGLPRKTENTITDKETLYNELEEIRERGYAFDIQEYHSGIQCVAAPIFDPNDKITGSISVSGPTSRMKGERLREELPTILIDIANMIEVNLAYSMPS